MPGVLAELKEKGLLMESQGAQIVDLSQYNLGVAVAVKSDGGTTYLLRDLATFIFRKAQGFKKQIYVVDVRQYHTLAQTFKILELLGHIQKPDEAIHIAYGFLTLPTGAMSTRKGTVVGAKEFIEGVQKEAFTIIKEKNPELSDKEGVAKIVASSAIKYFDLSHNLKSDIVFDPKEAISFEGKTGPYLQYAHARINGILRKNNLQLQKKSDPYDLKLKPEEITVLRKLNKFTEIVEQAAKDYMPNILTNYLFELSQNFNSFYETMPVLQEENKELKAFRLNLVTATAQVLKNGLGLLGIEAPEEM
jgi:arginyl-tRNA synthetase